MDVCTAFCRWSRDCNRSTLLLAADKRVTTFALGAGDELSRRTCSVASRAERRTSSRRSCVLRGSWCSRLAVGHEEEWEEATLRVGVWLHPAFASAYKPSMLAVSSSCVLISREGEAVRMLCFRTFDSNKSCRVTD